MTQVSLIVKDTHGKFSENNNVAISQGDSTTIIIKSNETVKIAINPSEIASVTQEGNNVVFHLKDGTKVIVENFYLAENKQIILQNGQKYWEAKLISEAEGNIFVEYVELTELPHMVSDTTSIYSWILGGLAGAGLVALITDKDRIDTTPPEPGVLQLQNYTDTGISSTDQITQDKSFALAVTGQETGTTIRYLVSKDAGQTWQETTTSQTDLADGTYQFKAVVTDAAGNSSETAIQQLMVDNIAPPQANLVLINFDDTGSSLEDKISLDNSFNLSIANSIVIGAEVALLDHFEVSKDGGLTWNETTVNQNDLVDGSYLYKAIVTDLAGNKTESAIQKVIVDRNLELSNDSFKIESFTEDNTISLLEKEQLIPIRISLNSLPEDIDQTLTKVSTMLGETTVNFVFDAIQQDWVAEVSTNNLWSDQQQNSLTIDINITDIAGNTTSLQKVHTYLLNHQPSVPILLESKNSLLEGVVISGMAFKGSTIDLYKADGTWLADTVVDEDGYFTIQTELSDLDQEIYVTSNYEGYVSEPSLHSKITEVPSLNIISISQSGMITGLATASSTIYVKDINGNLIQAFSLNDSNNILLNSLDGIDLGSIQSFSLQLDQQLPEGTEIVITAEKDGTLGFSHTITTDYTPADFLETPKFDQNGDFLSVLVSEPNTWILVTAESGQVIGAGYTDENGFIEVEIWQTLKEGELVTVVTRDGNHNIKELVIEAPNFAYAPEVHHISQNGLMNGYAEAGSTIYVKDFEGVIIGETTVYSEYEWLDFVEFSLSVNRTLNEGEELSVYLVDSKGVTSAETLIQVDFTAPLAPENLSFNADGDWIYGTAEPYAEITVKNSEGYILNQWSWSNWANQEGKFAIELSKFLTDADIIYVTATDSNGNESSITELVAPDYAFAPIIENLSNSGVFSGYAENNSTLIIKDINGLIIAETAIFDGNDWNEIAYFNFTLERPLIDGEVFHLSIQDERGQISKETVVVADVSAPNVIENIVFNQNGQNFTGTAEVQSYIEVFDINANQVGWGNVDALGNVSGHFYQTYLNGEELTFVVIDRAGNRSLEYKQTALNDDVAPNPIENLILNENGQGFTASIEADSRVEVFDTEGNQVGWGYADNLGNVSGYFYQTYLKGEELTFVVIDRAGNRSTEVKQIALIDDIAPNAIENLILNEDGRRFTASVEAESRVEVFNTDGNQVGLGYADSLGNVSGVFYQTYLKGEVLTFVVIDRAGNRSPEVKQIALIDDIAPNAIENMILNEDGQGFTASVEADSRVEVFNTEGNQVGWGYADSLGNVSGMFYQTYLNGEELTFVVIDRAGNRSVEVKQTALDDDVAPLAVKNLTITSEGIISGEAEPNSTVEITDQYGAFIATTYVAYDGTFSQSINLSQYQNQNISLIVKDLAGNRSEIVSEQLPEFTNSPNPATDLKLDAEGHVLMGIATAGMTLIVTKSDGELINGWWYNTVNDDGSFNISLNDYYLQGQTLQVRVFDPNTNLYSLVTEIIAPLDNIAPIIDEAVISEDGYTITGQVDSKAIIKVVDADGNLRAEYQTDENGYFILSIYPPVLRGEQLFITATDLAKNISAPFNIDFHADINAPQSVENVVVADNGFFIEGNAVPNSYIYIVDVQSNYIANGYVNESGYFNIQFYPPQASGQTLRIVVEQNGYQSAYTEIMVPVDTVAPNAPTELSLKDGNLLSGQAEAYSTVNIFDENNNQVGQAITDSNGIFSTWLSSQFWHGETLTVNVVDINQNVSSSATIIATTDVTAPDTVTQLAINEWGSLIGQAESNATVEITYYFDDQLPSLTNTMAWVDGTFSCYIYENATSVALTVVDRAGNRSEKITQILNDLPKITVDQFKGDATDNTYMVDHTNDFIQEYTVVAHDVFQDIWMDTSHYEEQWVVSGYSNYLWVESGYYEDIWIDTSYYEDVWVDTSFYQDVWIVDGTRDVYTDLNGLNYYSNDGSYDAYLSNYYDYNLNQWQLGYELSGPYVEELGHYEQQLVQDGYYESKWIEQGHYEQQYVNDGYFEEVWIDTSDYQNVWVESGYWETQIVGIDYTDVDLGGHDKIISSVSYSLSGVYELINDAETTDSYLESGRYVEDLELVGSAHLYATGNALDNLLTGNAGNNDLNGKEGNDTYLGADGSDKIIFHLLNYYDATGGNGQDTMLDFYLGDVKVDAQVDQIDLSNLFVSSALDETTVVDFIDVKQENGNSIISIDLDGVDSTYESTPLLTLLQTNTTLDELLNNQQIVLFN